MSPLEQQQIPSPAQRSPVEAMPLPAMRFGLACQAIEQYNGGS